MEKSVGRHISVDRMTLMIAQGVAQPLLRTSAPPVRLHGSWWAVPESASAYVRVEDPEILATLDDYAARLTLAEAAGGRPS